MAAANKPRKKKSNVNPAQKERRVAIKDKKELHEQAERAIDQCQEMIEHFHQQVEPVFGEFTEEEKTNFNEIIERGRKDIGEFRTHLSKTDEKVDARIESTYKDNKIHPEEKLKLFEDVIGYAETVETVVNYMTNMDTELTDFVEKFNESRSADTSENKNVETTETVVAEQNNETSTKEENQ